MITTFMLMLTLKLLMKNTYYESPDSPGTHCILSDIRTNQCNEKKKIKYYCCLIHIKEDIWFKNRKSFSEIHRMFKLLDGNYQRSSRSVLPTWFIPNYGFPKEKSFISSTSNTLDGSKLLAPVKTN